MTLLGKIFTVLIFIMSVVFFAFSVVVYATHKNWKMTATNAKPDEKFGLGLKEQVEQARTNNKQLRQELAALQNELAKERAARRQALAVLQSKLTQYMQQLVQKETELTTLQAANGAAVQELKATQDTMARLTDEVNVLRTKIRDAEVDRDTQFASVVALTDNLNQLQGVHSRLNERRDQLVVEVSRYKKQLDVRGIKVEDPVENIVPKVNGEVTAVSSADKGLVEISIGSDDGLRNDHQLDVFRNATYLGKIKVMRTSPDKSVAQIIKESQRGPIMKGDKVGSKLISVSSSN